MGGRLPGHRGFARGTKRLAVLLAAAGLLATEEAAALTLATTYVGTVFGVPDRYDYAPTLMRNSRADPALVRCWFGGEEWGSLVRVKAGETYRDPQGLVWSDQDFSGGDTYGTDAPIAGTPTPELYRTCREGTFRYTFSALPLDSYAITLKFAELAGAREGERVFDVLVNGGAAGERDALDVVAAAGGADRALDLTFWAFNTTAIEISFRARTGEPMVSAIEISVPFLDTIKYAEARAFPGGWTGAPVVLCPSEEGADRFENPDYPSCRTDFPAGPDRFLVNDPSVVFVDGLYWMYYTAPQVGAPTPGTCNQIFLARSADGRSWTKFPDASHPPQPVVPYSGTCAGTTPFEYGVGEPSVVFRDGRFWMFYYGSTAPGVWREMLATSSDGVTFTPGVSILDPGSTFGLTGGDVKWIPGWNLWLLVGSVRTYPHLFPDPATKGIMRWSISRDGIHWLPQSFRPADRDFRTAKYQNMAPGLLGNELGHLGDGRPATTLTVPVVYGAGTVDARAWDLDAMELTFSVEPLSGRLEEVSPDLVARGWAYDPDTGTNDAGSNGGPSAPLGFGTPVRVVATEVRTGRSVTGSWQPAEESRCDLVTGGLAPDCWHGFRIDLSRILTPGTWRVRVEGREFPDPGETLLTGEVVVTVPRPDRTRPDRVAGKTPQAPAEVQR